MKKRVSMVITLPLAPLALQVTAFQQGGEKLNNRGALPDHGLMTRWLKDVDGTSMCSRNLRERFPHFHDRAMLQVVTPLLIQHAWPLVTYAQLDELYKVVVDQHGHVSYHKSILHHCAAMHCTTAFWVPCMTDRLLGRWEAACMDRYRVFVVPRLKSSLSETPTVQHQMPPVPNGRGDAHASAKVTG